MKMLIALALVWLGLATAAKADDANTNTHTPKLEWAYQGASFADMLTTLDIKNHPANLVESNPLLGPHPSDAKVVGYFAASGLLHWAITRELVRENVPAPIVNVWEALGIGFEVRAVSHNYRVGCRMRF